MKPERMDILIIKPNNDHDALILRIVIRPVRKCFAGKNYFDIFNTGDSTGRLKTPGNICPKPLR